MGFTEHWEARRQSVYVDSVGKKTIGVGFNLERGDARARIEALGLDYQAVLEGRQDLTNSQIDTLLQQDIETARSDARALVSNLDSLPSAAQFIVVDMVFNLGRTRFSGFRNARAALEERNFSRAADEMRNSTWYSQVGRRSEHHVRIMRGLASPGP